MLALVLICLKCTLFHISAKNVYGVLVAVREGAILAGPQGPLWHWLSERKHHQAGRLARQRLDLRVVPLQGKVQKRIVRAATRGLPKWPHFSLPPTQLGGQHLAPRAGLILKSRRRKSYLQLCLIALWTKLGDRELRVCSQGISHSARELPNRWVGNRNGIDVIFG